MTILTKLQEIFPDIDDTFLRDIYEAYREEDIDIEILTDLVLSFENPPTKKNLKNGSQELQNSTDELTLCEASTNPIPNEDIQTIINASLDYERNKIYSENSQFYLGDTKSNGDSCSNNSQYEDNIIQDSNAYNSSIKNDNVMTIAINVSNQEDSDDKQKSIETAFLPNKQSQKEAVKKDTFSDIVLSQFDNGEENEFEYLLENTFLINPIELFMNKIKITTEDKKQVNFKTLSSEDFVVAENMSNLESETSERQEIEGTEMVRGKLKPRLEEFIETIKMDTFDCRIERFLEDIPDPIAEFSSHNYPRDGYEGNAEIYLTSRYQEVDPVVIKDKICTNNYNMTIIAADFEAEGFTASPYILDKIDLHHTPSMFFHQEVWFIEHRREIIEFLDSLFEAAKLELESVDLSGAESAEELFQCEICSEDVAYSDLGTCNKPNGHLFCKTCIRRIIEIKIGEGSVSFPCLAECDGFIDLQTVKEILPNETFTILMNKIQEDEVRSANMSDIETCPFCHYAYGPGDEDLFNCLNPACMKKSCRNCRKEDHSPNLCQQLQNENEETARHYVENVMTETLVRKCYKCSKPFIKEEGCNKMVCVCGASMCYLCRQPVSDYTHFNGPQGEHTDRCELFSEEYTIHEQPVAASGLLAFDQFVANNPGIELDANKIIPK